MSFEEIFNPSLSHAKDYLNAEKVLPAPTPAAGAPPLTDDDGSVIFIPPVTWGVGVLPDPPQLGKSGKAAKRPAGGAADASSKDEG